MTTPTALGVKTFPDTATIFGLDDVKLHKPGELEAGFERVIDFSLKLEVRFVMEPIVGLPKTVTVKVIGADTENSPCAD